jgi:hypothetical protein
MAIWNRVWSGMGYSLVADVRVDPAVEQRLAQLFERLYQPKKTQPTTEFVEYYKRAAGKVAQGKHETIRYNLADVQIARAAEKAGSTALTVFGYPPNEMRSHPHFSTPSGDGTLVIASYKDELPPDHPEKMGFLTDLYLGACDVVEPEFALCDLYRKQVLETSGQDLRSRAWGVTVYGPNLVKALGKSRLATVPAYWVEELDWGGYWIQLAENPCDAKATHRKKAEQHLGLSRAHFLGKFTVEP